VWCLVWMEQASHAPAGGAGRLVALAALAGILMGVGTLTRYSCGWLILPAVAFFAFHLGRCRILSGVVALAAFALVVAPWLARNYAWSETLFGTQGYALYQDTPAFPADRLERSLNPDVSVVSLADCVRKLAINLSAIVQGELPKLGGSWMTAF